MRKSIKEFHEDHEDVYIFLQDNDVREGNHFLQDVWSHLIKKREISIKQINGVRNSMLYYQKKQDAEKLREEHKNDLPNGNFVGKEKQRYDMTLKYLNGKSTSRGFFIHNFVDRNGNSLMCFSDNERLKLQEDNAAAKWFSLEEGDVFTCRATVNRHSVNDFDPTNKFKQTVLNRIKYNKYLGNKQNS